MNLAEVKSFGGTDANRHSLLLQSFEDHPSYIEMLRHKNSVLLDAKEVGSTAIFKKILTNEAYNVFLVRSYIYGLSLASSR